MFFSADDDDQDFMSSGSSKLANLFGMDKASGQGGNESLTYTAPKQPKKKETTQDSGTPVVAVASVVHAYKYVDNKYASQGKLGAALLVNHVAKDYRILLYVNKQQQVTNAKITQGFKFNIQENNYASFYDDARQTWSILFDSAQNAEKFAKEIAIAKANSATGSSDLVCQDMTLGEGGQLESGDSVEVKYTGWLLTKGTFGKVFDSNTSSDQSFRLKLGKGKVIKGWEQGMLGMKKGGKRLLVIPPALAYGSQGVGDRVPPESTLIFEVAVVRVKLQKGEPSQDTPAPVPSPSPSPSPVPVSTPIPVPDQDDSDDMGVKGRSKSISDQLSQSPDSNKAKLISRMARMGQPMLPFSGAVPAEPDLSDEEMQQLQQQADLSTAASTQKPSLPTKPRSGSTQAVMAQMVNGQPVMVTQAVPGGHTVLQAGGGDPTVMMGVNPAMMQQPQQQPAFLQNLPGAQQLAVYQNPNTFLQQQQQQQQAALLQQQQQQQQFLQQQQQQQQQQQNLLGQGMPGAFGGADPLAPVLLTETRQQNTEVRLSISKMADKVDKILDKIDHLHMNGPAMGMAQPGAMTPYGPNYSTPTMEANVLMQNVTRIVQENERLKKDVYEQSTKVHEQNEKINSLLEKNQKYVEQSQNLLEQRNDGYKHTASQSQARVLALEQEKIGLATELSTSSAQISSLQLELAEVRKHEGELRQKLQSTTSTSSEAKEELARLRLQKEEDEQKVESLTASVREEKHTRKLVEAKLSTHLEELADVRSSQETLEKNLLDRKRKAAEERRKLEEDLEDAKISYEQTIEGLRERLRKQKTSVDAETESKVSKLEEEISQEWQTKCDRLMASATDRHNKQMAEVQEDKQELEAKLVELEKKLSSVRSSGSSTEQQMAQLQEELQDMKVWKEKYDNLRGQATSMKERYEKRIQEVEAERDAEEERSTSVEDRAREAKQEWQQTVQSLEQQVATLRTQGGTPTQGSQSESPAVAPATPHTDVSTEVKKIMNSVYQSLRGEFDMEESYPGSDVMATILNVIKQTTLKLVNQSSGNENESEEEEEEEEEEEADEDSEEEDAEELEVSQTTVPETPVDVTDQPVMHEFPTVVESSVVEEKGAVDQSLSLPDTPCVTELEQSNSDAEEEGYFHDALDSSGPDLPQGHTQGKGDDDDDDNVLEQKSEKVSRLEVTDAKSDHMDTQAPELPEVEAESDPLKATADEDLFEAGSKVSGEMAAVEPEAQESDKVPEVKVILPEENGLLEEMGSDTPDVTGETDRNSSHSGKEPAKSPEKDSGVIEDDLFEPAPKSKEPSPPTSQSLGGSRKDSHKSRSDSIPSSVEREPPPMFDDSDDDEDDSSLFGKDSTVADTFGFNFKARTSSTASNGTAPTKGDKPAAGKKVDLVDDDKPQPPPPLFGDDSDDDLDWLS